MEKVKVDVIFRKYKDYGDIVAVFPYEISSFRGSVMCYQHIGQHDGCDYRGTIKDTKLATPDEYKDLLNELENLVGYDCTILKRRNYNKYRKELTTFRQKYY